MRSTSGVGHAGADDRRRRGRYLALPDTSGRLIKEPRTGEKLILRAELQMWALYSERRALLRG